MTDQSLVYDTSMEAVMMKVDLPGNFIYGAATAAYQVEGAWNEDGRGESIWDSFAHKKGTIRDGSTGDVACDHYHRYSEDVAIMKTLNLDAYRFSISWSRVLPEGKGRINHRGLDFYKKLLDSLLEHDITPYVTLFHWDLPLYLQEKFGGFYNRQCSDYFADYAAIVAKELGDRAGNWITLNEPQDYASNGHFLGEHAPGHKRVWEFLKVVHHLLLGHGKAVQSIKAVRPESKVGITLNLMPVHPRTESERDMNAAGLADQFMNRVTLDPLFRGSYPEKLFHTLRWFKPKVEEQDWDYITTGIDFLGVNNYTREFAYHVWYIPLLHTWMTGGDIAETEYEKNGRQYTSMGWEVFPRGMYDVLMRLKNEYGNPPVLVTENGAAFDDVSPVNGRVPDEKRVQFINGYLHMIARALQDGSDVRGYFVWSLLDNFEWSVGFTKRFGIVYVNYETLERTIKDSGLWYMDFIKSQKNRQGEGGKG